MSELAISSFSLNRKLGPLRLQIRDADGVRQLFELPLPQEITLEEFAAEAADRLGVSAVEICQIQLEDDAERIDRLRKTLDASGIRVLTVPIDIGTLSSSRGQHLEEDIVDIEHWLDIAQKLGAVYARVNAGLPHEEAALENRPSLLAALRRLSDAAQARNLRLLVENHGGESSDPDYLISLREEVGPDRLGILLDLGNFPPVHDVSQARLSGQPIDDLSIDTEDVYSQIETLAPYAELVHAKAYDPRSDGTPLLDIDRALAIVASSGYNGDITVEWEGALGDPWDGTVATADAVRRAFPLLRVPADATTKKSVEVDN